MFANFSKCKEENLFCDVTLKVSDEDFPVHKLMLASASKYFKALFTTNMQERRRNVIEIKEITSFAMKICVGFIYSGKLECLQLNQVDEVLNAACMFQIWELREICFKRLEENLEAGNCIGYWQLAEKYEYEPLRRKAARFLNDNIDSVLKESSEFGRMGQKFIETCLRLDSGNLADEKELHSALVLWVKYDEENRRAKFCELLQLVRLPVMETRYLCDVVLESEWVLSCNKCTKYVVQSMAFQTNKSAKNLNSEQMIRRGKRQHVLMMSDKMSQMFDWCLENNKSIKTLSFNYPLNGSLDRFGVAVRGNELFRIDTTQITPGIWCRDLFNEDSEKWVRHTESVDLELSCFACTFYEQYLFVVGGRMSNVSICNAQKYDVINKTWYEIGDLIEPREHMSMAVLGTNMYIMAGGRRYPPRGRFVHMKSVERFDMSDENGTWMGDTAPIHGARVNATAAVFKGEIYLMGGDANLHTAVEIYNQTTNIWTNIPSTFNLARTGYDAIVLNDKLIVMGGNPNITQVEEWDEEEQVWHISKNLTLPNPIATCKIFTFDSGAKSNDLILV